MSGVTKARSFGVTYDVPPERRLPYSALITGSQEGAP
ncbi:hypothetical protein EV650_7298 [Kribbella kalugense]|uniref:Uncharacterized protein n=1 Tax=Kribbella kalugense TaxID=2512221 RepID=A0A4V3G6L6_9ACTN|nr:hypothetical protein EV650_7298 [Kribbella kalugense]